MASPGPSATPNPKTPTNPYTNLLSIQLNQTNDLFAHLQRILATTSGVDTTLLFLGYGSNFIQANLARILDARLTLLADRAATETAKAASRTLNPGETLIATLTLPAQTATLGNVQQGLKALAGACTDVRAFMRLWGLLGIWAWARRLMTTNEPRDMVLRVCAYVQLIANGAYLLNEHPAYLAGKGILKSSAYTPDRVKGLWKNALRWFAVHVTFEFIRLFRTWQLRKQRQEQVAKGEKSQSAEEEKRSKDESRLWWKSFLVYSCYAPLTVHWASETGFFGDGMVGFLGMCAGAVGFREVWRQTA